MLTAVYRAYLRRISGRRANGQRGDWTIRILLMIMLPLMLFTVINHPWFQPLLGHMARETARLTPSVGGWLSMDAVRGKAILQAALPTVAEVGRDPIPNFGWRHTLRSWLYVVLGYDMSQPRTLFLAAVPGLHLPPPEETVELAVVQPKTEPIAEPEPAAHDVAASPRSPGRDWGREPLVLIFHTHTSEMYATGDDAPKSPQHYHMFNTTDTGIVRVGEALARTLSERHGIPVLHSKAIHDFPNYAQSYQRSATTVQRILSKHPSIRLVLDVHRDGAQNVSFVRQVGSQSVAQVMVVVTKPISYSEALHPRWAENVQVANLMKKTMEAMYPGLLRPYAVVGRNRYNQHLHPHMLLLEVGNYIDDEKYALRSAVLMADVVARVLSELPAVSLRPSTSASQVTSSAVSGTTQEARSGVQPPLPQTPAPTVLKR
ncbi:MAG: stage II sporulation protein P [Limnochordia bacterium]|jgi:stage II sporulation protein P